MNGALVTLAPGSRPAVACNLEVLSRDPSKRELQAGR